MSAPETALELEDRPKTACPNPMSEVQHPNTTISLTEVNISQHDTSASTHLATMSSQPEMSTKIQALDQVIEAFEESPPTVTIAESLSPTSSHPEVFVQVRPLQAHFFNIDHLDLRFLKMTENSFPEKSLHISKK